MVGTIALYFLLASNAALSLFRPWIGIGLAYTVILLTPQNIWWWAFEGIQPLQWFVTPALIGLLFQGLRGRTNLLMIRSWPNFLMAWLAISATLAYFLGPYVDVVNQWKFYDSAAMLDVILKAYVIYFAAVLIVDTPRKLLLLFAPILVSALYLGYWANAQYFFEGRVGRIGGPRPLFGRSIYHDENIFATIFVVGFPIVLYAARTIRNRLISLALWAAVPMLWHAAFLTGSRGALLAIAVVLLAFVIKSRQFAFGIVLGILFAIAVSWQGGDTLLERTSTIADFRTEQSASGRLEAWQAALAMMKTHPLTGVGLASFGQAFPTFSDAHPRIAHNTPLQIAAEWGILAGIAYLCVIGITLAQLAKGSRRLRRIEGELSRRWIAAHDALFLAIVGFFVCSMFLSLEKFELFHYLIALANGTYILGARYAGTIQQPQATGSATRSKHHQTHSTDVHL